MICSGPNGVQSKRSGGGDDLGQPVHLQIAFRAPTQKPRRIVGEQPPGIRADLPSGKAPNQS